jgi:hypothetical protein
MGLKRGFLLIGLGMALVTVPVGAASTDAGAGALRYRLAAGQAYRVDVGIENHIQQRTAGVVQERTLQAELQYTCKVTDVDEAGAATLEWTCEKASVRLQTPFEAYQYSSDQKEADLPESLADYTGIAGRLFKLRLTPAAEITELEAGSEKVVVDSKDLKGSNLMALLKRFEENRTGRAIQGMITEALSLPRTGPVPDGTGWTRDLTLPLLGSEFSAGMKLAVAQRSPEAVILSLSGPVDRTFSKNHQVELGRERVYRFGADYRLAGNASGTAALAAATGWVTELDFAARLEGEVQRNGRAMPLAVQLRMTMRSAQSGDGR